MSTPVENQQTYDPNAPVDHVANTLESFGYHATASALRAYSPDNLGFDGNLGTFEENNVVETIAQDLAQNLAQQAAEHVQGLTLQAVGEWLAQHRWPHH
ncbi:hypothetical protein [Streptomyces cucumeris]|uniref:hypothetical protein n=1 Tax=Streptomyces cucumeris TaxID=2962890 RepID=UPI0020C8DB42|nr:hypothetical protein [Streptomyces sp. NEAU-Y11]MCP9213173.1 hypothetical protein [Streptomyces sp. NEAU-Y11]